MLLNQESEPVQNKHGWYIRELILISMFKNIIQDITRSMNCATAIEKKFKKRDEIKLLYAVINIQPNHIFIKSDLI